MNKFSKIILLSSLLCLGSIISCTSESEMNLKSNDEQFTIRSKSTVLTEGTEIATIDVNGDVALAVPKVELVDYLNNYWVSEGVTITDVAVKKLPVEGLSNQWVYAIIGLNINGSTKVAETCTFQNVSRAGVVAIVRLDTSPKISCTSTECQFGCDPAALVNPKTGKVVVTCSTCANKCTKTTSAG